MKIFGETYFKQSQFQQNITKQTHENLEMIPTSRKTNIIFPQYIQVIPKLFPLLKEISSSKKRQMSTPNVSKKELHQIKKIPLATKACLFSNDSNRDYNQFQQPTTTRAEKHINTHNAGMTNLPPKSNIYTMMPKIKEIRDKKSQFITLSCLMGLDSGLVNKHNHQYSIVDKEHILGSRSNIEKCTSNNLPSLTIQDRYKLYQIQHELNKLKNIDNQTIARRDSTEYYYSLKPYLNTENDNFITSRVEKAKNQELKTIQTQKQLRTTKESNYHTISKGKSNNNNQANLMMKMFEDSKLERWEQSDESIKL